MVVAPLYRSILKQTNKVVAAGAYKSLDETLQAVFGIYFPFDHRSCLPVLFPSSKKNKTASGGEAVVDPLKQQQATARRIARWFFSGVPCLKGEQSERLEAAFDALRRLQIALPDEAEDTGAKYFVGRAALSRIPSHFPSLIQVVKPRSFFAKDGINIPLPRHQIPSEPFYFLSASEKKKFLYLRHYLAANVRDSTVLMAQQQSELQEPVSSIKKTSLERQTDVREALQKFATMTVTRNDEHGFEIACRTEYIGLENETLEEPKFLFKYSLLLRNVNPEPEDGSPGKTFLLLSRHWNFVDAAAKTVEDFVGPGVVGEFPVIAPEKSYRYSSGTSLEGPIGAMNGTFQILVFPKGIPEGLQGKMEERKKNITNVETQHEQNLLDLEALQIDVRIGATALRAT